METCQNLALAYEALRQGGNQPCILNAANEVVVEAFLQDRVSFLGMSDIIAEVLNKLDYIEHPSLEDYLETDQISRIVTKELLKN